MKSPPWIYPQFISPMSGRINTTGVQALTPNYTFIGDKNGFVLESPILIDIRLELIRLRNLLGTTAFILQEEIAGFNNAQALNLVRNGMISVSNGIIIPTNLTENKFWIGDENNFPVETDTLPSGGLPDLTFQNTWIGNNVNRPVPILFNIVTGTGLTGGPIIGNGTISIANTGVVANLYSYASVRVNSQGQIIEAADNSSQISSILSDLGNLASIVSALSSTVDALSSTVDAIETGIASIGGFGAFLILQAQVFGLIGAVSSLSSRMTDAENNINIINGQISAINTTIANLRLNNIPASGDVSISGFKLISVGDPVNPQDAATKHYVDNAISGIPGSIIITLGGAVSGTGPSNTTIHTTSSSNFIIQTNDSNLPNAQVLASLTSGILKNTTSTGVLSIASPGTDYYSPRHPTILIDDYIPNVNPILSTGNLGVGINTLNSLVLGNSSNTINTGLGQQSLYSFTTGAANVGVGFSSLQDLTTGNNNTACGAFSLYFLGNGSNNTACGAGIAPSMTSGNSNTFVGVSIGGSGNNFTNCTAVGYFSSFTTGASNAVSIGAQAVSNTTGVALGYNSTSSGSPSMALGNLALASATNAIAIGPSAQATATNAIALGNGVTAPNANTIILGSTSNVGIGTNNPQYVLDVHGIISSNFNKIINTASIDPDLYANYSQGQVVNLDWLILFLNNQVI